MPLFASVNDVHATSMCLRIPRVGAWTCDVVLDKTSTLKAGDSCTLHASDLTLSATLVRGSNYFGRFSGRVVGGRAGWRKLLSAKYYTVPVVGVKLSLVLTDAARECGETMGTIPIRTIGDKYVRPAREGSYLLNQLVPEWWVDFSGVTRVDPRPVANVTVKLTGGKPHDGSFQLSTDVLFNLVPGNTLLSSDVEIPISYVIHTIGSEVHTEVFA